MKYIITGLLLLAFAVPSWAEEKHIFFCMGQNLVSSHDDGQTFNARLKGTTAGNIRLEVISDRAVLTWGELVTKDGSSIVEHYIVTSYVNGGDSLAFDAKWDADSTKLLTMKRDIDSGIYNLVKGWVTGGAANMHTFTCTKF